MKENLKERRTKSQKLIGTETRAETKRKTKGETEWENKTEGDTR